MNTSHIKTPFAAVSHFLAIANDSEGACAGMSVYQAVEACIEVETDSAEDDESAAEVDRLAKLALSACF